jgi:primosomal protein N' (replication factor Y)
MYAEILIPQKVGNDKETLTYKVPENTTLELGQIVKVNLRRKTVFGIVWNINNREPAFRTLEISEIPAKKSLISSKQIELINWMSSYYFCPIHKLIKYFIPNRVFQNKILPKRLNNKNVQIGSFSTQKLNQEQEAAFSTITTEKKNKFLIHGITGSGKTEIYSHLSKHCINNLDKQVLILVPEISLTPQIIEYFEKSLGIAATVINSKISEGERQLAWENIWNNKSKLVIGSRSAIFAPFQNLGMIIIDEEHENSYKQDKSPRYNIHQLTNKLQEQDPSLKVILGSATPSIETSEELKDSTIILKERFSQTTLPKVEIIDLRDEFKKHNHSIFSDRLKEEIQNTLDKKEQAILFLNRRGSASSIVCRDCGYTAQCTKCETPLTYHSKTLQTPKLICHHCGEISKPVSSCPTCKGANIRFLGIGTQKIEEEVHKAFPQAKTLRADKDTTSTKHGFKDIYKKFRNQEADILIGTQMIAKGLHLPNVNLVGVILADIGLNIPDFRSEERNFQLMTQVSGRAGRISNEGKVIIQTYNPAHFSLICTQENNYAKFFNYERTQRKLLNNPPFGRLGKLVIENKSLQECQKITERIENLLWTESEALKKAETTNLVEIRSYPAYLARLRGKYRYVILIKTHIGHDIIHKLLEKLPKEYIMDSNIKIDIDPISTT